MERMGHKDRKTRMRYAHLLMDHKGQEGGITKSRTRVPTNLPIRESGPSDCFCRVV